MTINDTLRRLRQARGLTLFQVSTKIPCDPDALSKWERGTRRVPLEVIVKLAAVYAEPALLPQTCEVCPIHHASCCGEAGHAA